MRYTKQEWFDKIGAVCYKNHVRIKMPGITPVAEEERAMAGNARLSVRAEDLERLKAAFQHRDQSKFKWPAVAA